MSVQLPLRGALIGCGNVSKYHLEAWKEVPNARLTALCELDPNRLVRAGAAHPDAQRYPDAAAMFAAGRYDFVEICTGPGSHRELVALAGRHGAHILCQKPAAAVRSDFLAMIETCNAHDLRLMIHENWRFRPWYREMRAELDAGTIGRPIRLRISHRDTRALRPDGFAEQPFLAHMSRLILLEMGCHLVDTARYLIGEIESVSATLGRFARTHCGEDVATLSVQFAGGALGLLDMSWCAPPDLARPEWALNETVVEGDAATLKLRPDGSLDLISLDGKTERRPVALPPADRVYVDAYIATQRHFIDRLIDGAPHETSASDNLKTMEVVWAAYRSAEEGRAIAL